MTGWAALQEALLTKRAQNLMLWALGSYGAAVPSAQCLGMKMLMDDVSIVMHRYAQYFSPKEEQQETG